MSLTFIVQGRTVEVDPAAVVIAGYTGRDRAVVEAHVAELADLGVPPPATIPAYYLAAASAATQAPRIGALHGDTSGEAEPVLVVDGAATYLTLGSDHTDRTAEALDIGLSKAVCPKPLAAEAWPLDEVADHLDDLELASWITVDGAEEPYQQGRLAALTPPPELLAGAPFATRPAGFVLFCGTVPAIGGIRPAAHFRASLHDPVLGRSITFGYGIDVLDVLLPPASSG